MAYYNFNDGTLVCVNHVVAVSLDDHNSNKGIVYFINGRELLISLDEMEKFKNTCRFLL